MSFRIARCAALTLAAAALVALPVAAQSSHDLPLPPPPATSQQPGGQVIFSRSTDANGQVTCSAGPTAGAPGAEAASAPTATDAERQAVTITAFDMDVHLRTAQHGIAVRALLTVRNDGKTMLPLIPLQLSSTLNWERIRVNNRDVQFPVATLNSDADHTGQLHEAAVPLSTPLVPGASVQLDVSYSGTIDANAQRLLAIGTPADVALHSDWDSIGVQFTGLRGFGNVVWYPAASVPVVLGQGARLFDEMGEHKLRLAGASFRLRLTVEYPYGEAPNVALINGHPAALHQMSGGLGMEGIATATLDGSTLGFEAPSLFVAQRTAVPGTNTTLWILPAHQAAAQDWTTATSAVTPFLQGWLGKQPREQPVVLDLPDAEDAPFETGAMLATAVRTATPDQLDGILAHALTHAWMQSPRAWLSEGVAHFMGTLWIERERGRKMALESLEASRQALALAEPSSPGMSPGQPLAQAISPIYYRVKATYVFWMLRSIVGDASLSAALRAYNPADDVSKGYGRDTGSGSFEQLLEQSSMRSDLSWFFNDWVDADKGLPDLKIDSVFPAPVEAGNWLVAVNVSNSGYAAAEVPVTVTTQNTSVTQRMLIGGQGKAITRILVPGKPVQVQVNDGTVPETEASVHITNLTPGANGVGAAVGAGVAQ